MFFSKSLKLFLILVILSLNAVVLYDKHGTKPEKPPTLSCEQVLVITHWGLEKFVAKEEVSLDSTAFETNVLHKFAEMLDPYKVLLLQEDVVASHSWSRVLKEKDCGFYSHWIESIFEKRKKEFLVELSQIDLSKFKPQKKDPSEISDPKFHRPKQFSKNSANRKKRIAAFAKSMVENSYPTLIRSYEGSLKRLVQESSTALLFGIEFEANELLVKSALKSMDPYSTYFGDEEFSEFYADLSGGTVGLGVQVRKVPQGLLIEEVIENSPAGGSALEPGDLILYVDSQPLSELTMAAARSRLKGPEGSPIQLSVKKKNGKFVKQTIIRKNFAFNEGSITHELQKDERGTLAVIDIPSFYGRGNFQIAKNERSVSEELEHLILKLQKEQSLRGIVLDLRGNPGGYLEEAISMAGLFLGDLPVVGVFESGRQRTFNEPFQKPIYEGPLTVIYDYDSASASEVLAGALASYKRALLIGVGNSYGKGSIQRMFHLNEELNAIAIPGQKPIPGVVKITTSLFYSPEGKTPARGGISPDISLPDYKQRERSEIFPYKLEHQKVGAFVEPKIEEELEKSESTQQAMLQELSQKSLSRQESSSDWKSIRTEKIHEALVLEEAVEISWDYALENQPTFQAALKVQKEALSAVE